MKLNIEPKLKDPKEVGCECYSKYIKQNVFFLRIKYINWGHLAAIYS